jgi:hypothetical protein
VSRSSVDLTIKAASPEVIGRFIATNIEWTSLHLGLGSTAEKVEALLESTLHDRGERGLPALCNKVIYLCMRMHVYFFITLFFARTHTHRFAHCTTFPLSWRTWLITALAHSSRTRAVKAMV